MISSNKKAFSPYKKIVEKIEEATGIKRINMRELGAELGVTTSAVSDFSKKDYFPTETMFKWCKKRDVSVDWILGGATKPDMIPEVNPIIGKELDMLKDEFLNLQREHISVLKENSQLKDKIISLGSKTLTKKKVG